jgi:uncharacterized OB-fold protein
MTELTKPTPILDNLSREWFEAAAEGRFLIQRRGHDGGYQWYPRAHALGTLDTDVEWVEASGRGVVHTFSVAYRSGNEEFAEDCPYVLAIIELEEGPRVSSRVVDVDPEEVRCDMPVQVTFRQEGEVFLPYFVPAGDAA